MMERARVLLHRLLPVLPVFAVLLGFLTAFELQNGVGPWFPFDRLWKWADGLSDPALKVILKAPILIGGVVLTCIMMVGCLAGIAFILIIWTVGLIFQGFVW